MARDLKLTQDSTGNFDISFLNGDFELVDTLEPAFLMSVFYKQRATDDQVAVPQYREGHFTDIFNTDPNYQVGCYLWLVAYQAKLIDSTLFLAEDTVRNDGLQWLIDDNIVADVEVEVEKTNSTSFTITASFKSGDEQNSQYYQTFINTFS